MMLPRDLSGDELARLLRRHYGYRLVRLPGLLEGRHRAENLGAAVMSAVDLLRFRNDR